MTVTEHRLSEIASRHGVDINEVVPLTRQQRAEALAEIVCLQDVPFPITPERQKAYLQAFHDGIPFGVGTLTGDMVDLGQYSNFQHYGNYTIEEHLSWACLIADQQNTKHRFACRECTLLWELPQEWPRPAADGVGCELRTARQSWQKG
jgi:hypothetical protein